MRTSKIPLRNVSQERNNSKGIKTFRSQDHFLRPNFELQDAGFATERCSINKSKTKSKESQPYTSSLSNNFMSNQPITFQELKAFCSHRLHQNIKNIEDSQYSERVHLKQHLKSLKEAKNWQQYLQSYFDFETFAISLKIKNEKQKSNIPQGTKSSQKRKIMISPDKMLHKTKEQRFEYYQNQNQELKIEVARCKQTIKDFERKILLLIQQRRDKKIIYVKQIERLTDIIKTSLKDIPELVLKYKQMSNLKDFIVTRNELSPIKKNDYNQMAKYNPNSFLQSTVEHIFQSFNPENNPSSSGKGTFASRSQQNSSGNLTFTSKAQ